MYLGAHLSAAGGVWRAVQAAADLKLEALQVFLRPPGRWRGRAPGPDDAARLAAAQNRTVLTGGIVVHGPYLLNPASGNEDLRRRSIEVLVEELEWAGALGLNAVVIHPGSAGSGNREEAESRCRAALAEAVERAGPTASRLLLEGTAGAGGQLGRSPLELARLRDRSLADKIGICLDFAHLWAAGYDLTAGGWERVLDELSQGWEAPSPDLLHGNDTCVDLGSGRDRHTPPGAGVLGASFFRRILEDPGLNTVPLVVEMPPGVENREVAEVMARLRAWRSGREALTAPLPEPGEPDPPRNRH